jgi:hypothetical protein
MWNRPHQRCFDGAAINKQNHKEGNTQTTQTKASSSSSYVVYTKSLHQQNTTVQVPLQYHNQTPSQPILKRTMIKLPVILTTIPLATALRGIQPRSLSTDISSPSHCYPLLHASSSPSDTLDNERYYYFVDAMSNSYFSSSNLSTYDSLPTEIKYSFVTLSCQCQLRGEGEDCCLANNALLDSTGSDPDGPPPSEEQEAYLNDVCTTTAGAIGTNIAPGTGEMKTTTSPSATPNGGDDTPAPTIATPSITEPEGSGETDNNREVAGGLSGGAWAGIALAGAAVGTMLLYLIMRKEGEEDEVELDENADASDVRKERNARGSLAVKTDGEEEGDGNISPTSTMDATQSLTADAHSDVSSLPSSIGMSKSSESGEVGEGYNDLNLLPGRPDEESVLSGDEDNYFYSSTGNSSSLAAMGVASGAIVGMG